MAHQSSLADRRWFFSTAHPPSTIEINRATLLKLRAPVVFDRLALDMGALTLGRTSALNVYANSSSQDGSSRAHRGIREQRQELRPAETFTSHLLHRAEPVVLIKQGVRAMGKVGADVKSSSRTVTPKKDITGAASSSCVTTVN